MTTTLSARHVAAGYGRQDILRDLTLDIASGSVTTIIGPNACGKSTLLRALGRLITPRAGEVLLDGKQIARQPTKAVARRLALLPQGPVAPEGMTVRDLVARGRTPHQGPFRRASDHDRAIVASALTRTDLTAISERPLDRLSGGQRQRAWIAMALAQETPLLLLDEPTTYLDLRHQIDLLRLVRSLRDDLGKTILMVLHDINLAARFSDRIVAMKDGHIVCTGRAETVITPALIETVFDLPARVIADPLHDAPYVLPL